ncbi:MAG: ATP-dependent protease ATPase subunit HslU [Helicobacteraceae bacterium]|jgi:ATP-dependent HslUV protease ATP-binding subunit HslU|nr:ATP-dependent protease ATPase subunit HslU [Helicobacteraceae bacterium]
MDLTPKEIVKYLDDFIVGQDEAKKAIAIALRNRWRRLKLEGDIRDEVLPKNILLIGPTGVGKTEIARRMAKLLKLPFIKVEATKYTEVGFVGRDVESMIRDLVFDAIKIVKEEEIARQEPQLDEYIYDKIASELVKSLPKGSSEALNAQQKAAKAAMKERVKSGEADHLTIEIEISPKTHVEVAGLDNLPPEMARLQESIGKMFGQMNAPIKKETSVKEAKELLRQEASDRLLDMEKVRREALKRAEEGGVAFIDEMDKIALPNGAIRSGDPSKEGVQRDLLPIVEGSGVNTKYGSIRTDHILFIGAGAFHITKPSDLIAELQGRFPLRVEMNPLNEEDLYRILDAPKNSLVKQYAALMRVEGVELKFDDSALRAMAKLAKQANDKTEDIGARRLHTIMEKALEEISFEALENAGKTIEITSELIHDKLDRVFESDDAARYIL